MPTKIEWTESTWNPITGCTPISAGCKNCYAERMSKRLAGRFGYPKDDPFRVTLHPDRFFHPLRMNKPQMIFVCSMGDLFHEDVHRDSILRVWKTMVRAPQHTFQILTKRPNRMKEILEQWMHPALRISLVDHTWPLPNVWLGVTAENQATADERIPILLDTPAAVRFVSAEPLLGPITFRWAKWKKVIATNHLDGLRMLDWVIVGGETGPKARPMHPKWPLDIRDQCVEAGVPFFFKQWGEWAPVQYVGQDGKPYLCISCGRDGKKERVMSAFKIDGKAAFNVNMKRLGKKAAGRELGGRTWDEYPERTW